LHHKLKDKTQLISDALCRATKWKENKLPNIIGGPEKVTREGVNGSQSKFLCKNRYMSQVQTPKSKPCKKSDEHTNQQHRNDPLKVMNVAEKE
jgi:hypothetical protein